MTNVNGPGRLVFTGCADGSGAGAAGTVRSPGPLPDTPRVAYSLPARGRGQLCPGIEAADRGGWVRGHARASAGAAAAAAAQKQLGDYLDAVVAAAPFDSAATLISAADADAADQVADAITATLEGHGCPRGRWQSHLLCGALATVAQAMKAGEDLAKTAVTAGVRAALTACGVPRLAAGLAGRAATDALMKLTPSGTGRISAARCSC
jgi:hypothetical protein